METQDQIQLINDTINKAKENLKESSLKEKLVKQINLGTLLTLIVHN